ncbi:DUF2855 family protein [Aquipseudomonas alcaligenes]|uniref:DUF2855 family protein n=1 Tax=Aquipseudomonas alcaligenes TaxID=43263 RepID=A0A1N6NNV8_AQUAC|nr:DUF2855 family protein [Pseudomonas alcaligenes]SIP93717.1 Protein of unknown function [Pseudomonas alcaligenes]
MTDITVLDLLVDRADLARVELRKTTLEIIDIVEGQVLLKVDHFGLTANNISYAAFGDELDYWKFFPAPKGWGIVPVWGFAEVQLSRCIGIEPGDRFYGFYPMSSHLLVEPTQVKKGSFLDAAEHRQSLPLIYNQYLRASNDPLYKSASEVTQILLRPLFTTSFLLENFIAEDGFFGANRVLFTSASSKTAIGTSYILSKKRSSREQSINTIGLTSLKNKAFVENLGCYDQVLDYDEISELDTQTPTLIIDFSGNTELLSRLHRHFGQKLKYSCMVGAAHWNHRGCLQEDVPGPVPKLFLGPTHAQRLLKDWGGEYFHRCLTEHWFAFCIFAEQWLDIERSVGSTAVKQVYESLVSGDISPRVGHILSLLDSA